MLSDVAISDYPDCSSACLSSCLTVRYKNTSCSQPVNRMVSAAEACLHAFVVSQFAVEKFVLFL